MKKVFFSVLVVLIAFMFAGCGDEDPKITGGDEENEVSDEGGNQTAEDGETANDGEAAEPDEAVVDDEETVSDDDPGNTEEPDETEEPDGNNDPVNPGFDVIGTFNLSYSGKINTTVDLQSRGGNGTVEFTYNEMPNTFNEITIPMVGTLFPLAMLNSGNIIIVWLDSFGAGDISGASQKQVFGISVPQNIEIGSGNMANVNMYAFYGDMTVNITGGQFEINCVRTVTNVGNYEVTQNDGANIELTASGDLLDPAAGAAYLPYPACE